MTKEEFYKLAESRSKMMEPSVYVLTVFTYSRDATGYQKTEDGDWVLDIERNAPLYFSSLEKAEEALDHADEELVMFRKLHSALIQRIPIDVGYNQLPMEWWTYDRNKKRTGRSVCSSFHTFDKCTPAGKFFGRKEEEIRYHAGDIVEVYDENSLIAQPRVKLVKIIRTPDTREQAWKKFDERQKSMGEYPFDGFYVSDYFDDEMSDSYLCEDGSPFSDERSAADFTDPTFPLPE